METAEILLKIRSDTAEIKNVAEQFRLLNKQIGAAGSMLRIGFGVESFRLLSSAMRSMTDRVAEGLRTGVSFNAMLESQGVAFETLLGSREKAEARMRDLVKLAATTPFELGEVVQASRVLQALAGDSLAAGDGLRLIGDTAAAVGRPFQEVAFWVGRLAAALRDGLPMSEAIMRLTVMGLITSDTRKRLADLAGQALSTGQVMDVLRQSFGANSGAMARQAETFSGLVSTLKDSLTQLAGEASKPMFVAFKEALQEVLVLLGALPSETEKVVADIEAKVQRLRDSAATGVVSQRGELQRAADDLLTELRQRAAQLQTLLSGRAVLGADGQKMESPFVDKNFRAEAEAVTRAIRGVELALGLLGRAEGMDALAAQTRSVRDEIAQLEAQAKDVRTTIRSVRSGEEIPQPTETLNAEARARMQGLVAGSAEFARFVDRELELARRKAAAFFEERQSKAVSIFRTSALDAAGQKRLEELRAELATLEQTADQRASVNAANAAREAANNLVSGLLAREEKITEEYRKQAELDDEKEQRLRAEIAAVDELLSRQLAETALASNTKDAATARVLAMREAESKTFALQAELDKLAERRHKDAIDREQRLTEVQEQRRRFEEQALSVQLAERSRQLDQIEANRQLTQVEKARLIVPLLEEQNRLIAERIALLEAERAVTTNDEARLHIEDRIEQLRGQSGRNAGQVEATRSLGIGEQIGADLAGMMDQFGSSAQRSAQLITGPIQAGVSAIRSNMQGLLGDTNFWSTKLGTIGGPIMGGLTAAISNMFSEWIAGRIRAAAVSITQSTAEGTADAAAKAPGALLTSISSYGVAAAVGLAALTAAMASMGSFKIGGYTGDGDPNEIAGAVHRGEFVVNKVATDRIGRRNLETMMAMATQGPVTSSPAVQSGGGASQVNLKLALVNFRSEMRRFQQEEGVRMAFDYVTQHTQRV